MRIFFAGMFIFLSVLLSVLYIPQSLPSWLRTFSMILTFFVSFFLAQKYIQLSFVKDQTDEKEKHFEVIQTDQHEQSKRK